MAQDIVQEALLRVWQSAKAPAEAAAFQPYLFRIIVNLVRDHYRRRNRWASLRFWIPTPPDPADEVQQLERDAGLARAMRTLTEIERAALYLRFFEGKSYEEVARTLGRSEGSLRVTVHRSLEKLRKRLTSDGLASEGVEA